MKGRVFRRCTRSRCRKRLKPKARRCSCGSGSYTWCFVVDVARAGDSRKQAFRCGFATREQAESELNEIIQAVDADAYVEPTTATVAEYLTDCWLPAVQPPRLEATTWTEYARKIRNQTLPRIGSVPLQQLKPIHLNGLYADLLAHGRMDGKGGLSAKSVREIHVIMHKALGDAVRWGMLRRNVAPLADPPSNRMASVARRSVMRTWSTEELGVFLDHVHKDPLWGVWMLAANSGMRRSELGGVRWGDILFEPGRLAVRQRLASVDGSPELSIPKSDRSRRTIDLDRRTVAALQQHRKAQDAHRCDWGAAWHDLDLVVAREDGMWIHPDWLSEMFRRHVKAAKLPPIRMHDLRHTHASLLLQAGVHPKVVSERLGHHSVAFTLDTYAHVLPGMQAEAAEDLADRVFGTADGDDHEEQEDVTEDLELSDEEADDEGPEPEAG